ncbi:hypothetical protein BLOT_016833 [Blomia tropicalis]|nr:hypothetical protein BLOT_016833 [Blomia tropicalis]
MLKVRISKILDGFDDFKKVFDKIVHNQKLARTINNQNPKNSFDGCCCIEVGLPRCLSSSGLPRLGHIDPAKLYCEVCCNSYKKMRKVTSTELKITRK